MNLIKRDSTGSVVVGAVFVSLIAMGVFTLSFVLIFGDIGQTIRDEAKHNLDDKQSLTSSPQIGVAPVATKEILWTPESKDQKVAIKEFKIRTRNITLPNGWSVLLKEVLPVGEDEPQKSPQEQKKEDEEAVAQMQLLYQRMQFIRGLMNSYVNRVATLDLEEEQLSNEGGHKKPIFLGKKAEPKETPREPKSPLGGSGREEGAEKTMVKTPIAGPSKEEKTDDNDVNLKAGGELKGKVSHLLDLLQSNSIKVN